ncbi:MAG: hypothetical protein U1E63_00050 [Burkholderiales bacterium]
MAFSLVCVGLLDHVVEGLVVGDARGQLRVGANSWWDNGCLPGGRRPTGGQAVVAHGTARAGIAVPSISTGGRDAATESVRACCSG